LDGAVGLPQADLSIPNGACFGHRRIYNSKSGGGLGRAFNGLNGYNWYLAQWPYAVSGGTGAVAIVFDANNPYWFDFDGGSGSWVARHGQADVSLVEDASTHQLTFIQSQGAGMTATVFQSVSAGTDPGLFLGQTDSRGVTTVVYSYDATHHRFNELRRSYTSGGTTTVERLSYAYRSAGDGAGRLGSVTYQRQAGGGSWTDLQQVVYTYYGSAPTAANAYGSDGDLQTASQQLPDGSGGWDTVGVTYYRYYQGGDSRGFAHALQMHFGPEAYRRMFNDGVSITTADAATVQPYADHYFEYDPTSHAATKEMCVSCPAGGMTATNFTYDSHTPSVINYNTWVRKATQTLADSSRIITYTNAYGMPMLQVQVNPTGSKSWGTFTRYDDAGRPLWVAQPSAVALPASLSTLEGYDDLLHYDSGTGLYQYLNTTTGLIQVTAYYGPGDAAPGYVQHQSVQNGQSHASLRVRSYTYAPHRDYYGNYVYPVATRVEYPDAASTATTITTAYAYTWQADPDHGGYELNQLAQQVTTLPVVSSGQHGSGDTVTVTESYDAYGNLTQRIDERGIVSTYGYDVVLGVLTQQALDTAGLNLVTDFTYDAQSRLTQTLGPAHTVVLGGTATTVRRANWNVYLPSAPPGSGTWDLDQVWSGQGYATGGGPGYTYTLLNPVALSRSDKDGQAIDQITSKRSSGTGALSATDTFDQTDWQSWSSAQYNHQGQKTSSRVYHLIPSSGAGTAGTNYGQSDYDYDLLERLNHVAAPGGTITDTVWETPGRVASVLVGTDDSTPAYNMVTVLENQYDGGGIGESTLTQVTRYVSAASGDARVTNYGYDFRGRRTSLDNPDTAAVRHEAYTYDNLDRLTQTEQKDNSGTLIGRSQSVFDDRSRVYQSLVYAVSGGAAGNALTTDNWYDAAGNLIKSIGGGNGLVFRKTDYNGLGWPTASYAGYCTSNDYTTATTLANDVIVSQNENTYDEAGNVVSQANYQRLNDASPGACGALTTGSARVSYAATWYDGIDRAYSSANYGALSSFSRPATPPAASDAVLVSGTTFDDAGRVYQVTDPAGLVRQMTYDNAGRTLQTIAAVSGSTGDDLNQTTNYTYTLDGQVSTLTAVNGRTGNQTTTYTYGTTLSDSGVASNNLPRYVDYPDSVSGSDRVAMTYNRLGQMLTRTDQRGTVRTFNYDTLGRPTDDRVTTTGTGTDTAVLRVSSTYEVRGMLATLTSYDDPTPGSGTALNQVRLAYNAFSQLTQEAQAHGGTVTTSSPSVGYAYGDGSSGSNQIRPGSLTYPNGRLLDYDYGSSGGLNDRLNRLGALVDDATSVSLAGYTYLGAGTVVRIDYAQPGVRLDLWGGTSGTFNGWDGFGRIVDQRWVTTGGSPTDLDRYKYGYDRDSNRLWKQNTVGSGRDEFYTYDHLNRLSAMQRGTLTGGPPFTGIAGTPARELDYTLDPTGNWSGYLTKTSGATDLGQTRTASTVNEIITIANATGSAWASVAYDPAGNTTTLPQPNTPTSSYTAVYDAWNRLTKIGAGGGGGGGGTTVAQYQYDGRGRRIVKKTYTGGSLTETRHFYWSNAWQNLEERVGVATTADVQQVWGIRYVDELVCRDDATPQRLYAAQDANFNVTALLASASGGAVLQRFTYEPYGMSTVLDASWSPTTDAYAWNWRHQGLAEDAETGMYYNKYRYVHVVLGFLQRDPIGYAGGINIYQYVSANPSNSTDPLGLQISGGG